MSPLDMNILLLLATLSVATAYGAPSDPQFYPNRLQFHPSGSEIPFQNAWVTFKTHHGKTYSELTEENHRMRIFEERLKNVELHNYLYDMGLKSYKMGINHFSDMDPSEILSHKGLKKTQRNITKHPSTYLIMQTVAIPKSVDWREKGYVTPIKNQFSCGSCWAFSATGSLEGQNFRKTGKLVSLSEQNLIDCSRKEGNEGCDGGLMDNAFDYIKENGGIDSEDLYPYEGMEGSCHYNPESKVATVSGYMDIESGNEDKLTNAIATVGPISIGINAKESLFSYKGGIYEEVNCTDDALNHGVLAVGFGSENGKDYYIIKNSWGESWGEGGYFRLARKKNNMCGVASMASFPLV